MVFTVLGLGASGFFIGVCSGLLGIGGGMVMVPILRLGFGLSAYSATATSLFSMLFTSASGTTTHIRNKTCIPKLGVALGAGGCLTSVAGVYLGNISPSWVIMLVAGIVIAYSGITMLLSPL